MALHHLPWSDTQGLLLSDLTELFWPYLPPAFACIELPAVPKHTLCMYFLLPSLLGKLLLILQVTAQVTCHLFLKLPLKHLSPRT